MERITKIDWKGILLAVAGIAMLTSLLFDITMRDILSKLASLLGALNVPALNWLGVFGFLVIVLLGGILAVLFLIHEDLQILAGGWPKRYDAARPYSPPRKREEEKVEYEPPPVLQKKGSLFGFNDDMDAYLNVKRRNIQDGAVPKTDTSPAPKPVVLAPMKPCAARHDDDYWQKERESFWSRVRKFSPAPTSGDATQKSHAAPKRVVHHQPSITPPTGGFHDTMGSYLNKQKKAASVFHPLPPRVMAVGRRLIDGARTAASGMAKIKDATSPGYQNYQAKWQQASVPKRHVHAKSDAQKADMLYALKNAHEGYAVKT